MPPHCVLVLACVVLGGAVAVDGNLADDVEGPVARASTPLRDRPAPASSVSGRVNLEQLWRQARAADRLLAVSLTPQELASPPPPDW